MNKKDLKKIMHSINLVPNTNLGQVFLTDDLICQEQVTFADINEKDVVLEIGPGFGILTTLLAKRAAKVIAVEIDDKLCSYLKTTLPDNVELINGDVLEIDLPGFNKIVSNIPYQISSPLVFKLKDYSFDFAVIMLQSEFAKRLLAEKGSKQYSRLSVMASYYYNIELLRHVPRANFMPEPKVDSAIIKLTPKTSRAPVDNEPLFFKLLKLVFSERRKKIKNSLENQFFKLKAEDMRLTKKEVKGFLAAVPYPDKRPEELSLEQFIEIADELNNSLLKVNKNKEN